jgi:hypothetical protein
MSVPAAALIRTTTRDAKKLSLSAATEDGLEIARQKPSPPFSVDFQMIAASGRTTMKPR